MNANTVFHRTFSDGWSLGKDRADELARQWRNFQALCRRSGKRAQLNYHGAARWSFTAHERQA